MSEFSESYHLRATSRREVVTLLQNASLAGYVPELELLDGATTWTSVPANELVRPKRAVNRPWHEAQPMPSNPTLQQRVAWHRAHALACGCRPVPGSIRMIIAGESAS